MLDELYKNAVVSVTNKYNKPASDHGFHGHLQGHGEEWVAQSETRRRFRRLKNEANLPQTDFEKRAAAAMQAGKLYFEEVEGKGQGRTLYAATVVPAVTMKCASCHGASVGDLLGFIRYEVPIK